MNIVFFCQSVDVKDPVIGDTVGRIRHLAKQMNIKHIDVIAIRGQNVELASNISVHVLSRDTSSRFKTILDLRKILNRVSSQRKIDLVYLYMTPTVSPIFYLLKWKYGYKVVNWFAHTVFTKATKLSLKYFTDAWVSVNKAQTFEGTNHLHIVGQGVELKEFYPLQSQKIYDLVTVGRVTPVKRIENILESLYFCKQKMAKDYSLAICGDSYVEEDKLYKKNLEMKILEFGIQNQVYWLGSVPRGELNKVLNQSKAFVFTVPGGIGKATMEAMAVGLPVIITETRAADFFGKELSNQLICSDNIESLARHIHKILELEERDYQNLSSEIKKLVFAKYSMESFSERLANILEALVE